MIKKLKIFNTPWHIGHQNDLYRALEDVADFYILNNYTRRWDEKLRKLPKNVKWVTNFEKNKYDFALLHIDQQCLNMDLNKAILPKHMRMVINRYQKDLPVIWINHATPVYPENYEDGNKQNNYISNKIIKETKKIIGNDTMVVNSYQAKEDWGFGYPIWHGMNTNFWKPDNFKEPRVVTFVSYQGIGDIYYNRSYLINVAETLQSRYGIKLQWINAPGCFRAENYKKYKEFLARSLIYFNPTFGSPMPRSRTEAMLCGCCVVTTPQHDVTKFIEHGVNGIIVPHNTPNETAEVISILIQKEYKKAIEIGKKGRETAKKLFNRERYKNDWINLLKELKIYNG